MTDEQYLDFDGCAALLGLRPRQLRALTRDPSFPAPAGQDAGPFWREKDVLRWAARDPQRAARVKVDLWPDAAAPATFAGAVRLPSAYGLDEVVLVWATPAGRVGLLWRPQQPSMRSLREVIEETDAVVVVQVDADFGPRGPSLTALNRAGGGEEHKEYLVGWPDLARVLGQDMPYWPYLLRDPDLIAAWHPGTATVTAPARTDLDSYPLLRMAAMFDATHPTAKTLVDLVQIDQRRATRDARNDLRAIAERAARVTERGRRPGIVAAAEPLVVGDPDGEDLDPTIRRIGWMELLARTDTLSWQCVRQVMSWDGGRHFAFAHTVRINLTSPAGREWVGRLEPVQVRTAAFACMDDGDKGRAMIDPLTDAPVVVLADPLNASVDGEAVTALPQRLPATSGLAAVVFDKPIWIRTADGNLYPAPRDPTYGLNWGYPGGGPGALALLIHRLLDDITAQAAEQPSGAPPGLGELTEHPWPKGTVLTREQLEAARDSRPYHQP